MYNINGVRKKIKYPSKEEIKSYMMKKGIKFQDSQKEKDLIKLAKSKL